MRVFQVITSGEGELIVVKRPHERTPGYQYLPCTKCLGFFSYKCLTKHRRKCPLLKKHEFWKITNSKQESLLLVTSHMAQSIDLEGVVLCGMKETTKNRGMFDLFF